MPLWKGARRLGGANRDRSRSPRRSEAPTTRPTSFRSCVAKLFLANKISSKHAHNLYVSGEASGANGVADLARGKRPGNFCRDLRARLMKHSKVPAPYWFHAPVFDKKTKVRSEALIPCILPHELIDAVLNASPKSTDSVFPGEGYAEHMIPIVKEVADAWGLQWADLVPIGLHGDGTPMAAKMRDSLEQLSWNFCALPHGKKYLFFGLPRSMFDGRKTWDAAFTVWSWSMQHCAVGKFPQQRHDGMLWKKTDKARAAKAGAKLAAKCVHVQCRGDWEFYASVFSFPRWNSKRMCWRCKAGQDGPNSYRKCGDDAGWRQHRLGPYGILAEQRQQGISPSPIWATPGLRVRHVLPDFLHTVDLGVAADCIGNLFAEVLHLLPQATMAERVAELWNRIRAYYAHARPSSTLDNLTLQMIRQPKKPPKLRCKAAECRNLVDFAANLADEFSGGSEHRRTVACLLQLLQQIVRKAKADTYDPDGLAVDSKKFSCLYAGLEAEAKANGDDLSWRCKPKLHLMQELLEYTSPYAGPPSLYWTYLDEDCGARLAETAARRGGAKNPRSTAFNVVARFRAMAVISLDTC